MFGWSSGVKVSANTCVCVYVCVLAQRGEFYKKINLFILPSQVLLFYPMAGPHRGAVQALAVV
jgi:hypothetical protein